MKNNNNNKCPVFLIMIILDLEFNFNWWYFLFTCVFLPFPFHCYHRKFFWFVFCLLWKSFLPLHTTIISITTAGKFIAIFVFVATEFGSNIPKWKEILSKPYTKSCRHKWTKKLYKFSGWLCLSWYLRQWSFIFRYQMYTITFT